MCLSVCVIATWGWMNINSPGCHCGCVMGFPAHSNMIPVKEHLGIVPLQSQPSLGSIISQPVTFSFFFFSQQTPWQWGDGRREEEEEENKHHIGGSEEGGGLGGRSVQLLHRTANQQKGKSKPEPHANALCPSVDLFSWQIGDERKGVRLVFTARGRRGDGTDMGWALHNARRTYRFSASSSSFICCRWNVESFFFFSNMRGSLWTD